MFKNTYQSGLLSIFYSCGSNPLAIWDMEVQNGHVKRLTDNEVNSIVLEIVSSNVATTFISCPKKNQVLGIRLPFLVMIVKNLKRYFSFEITVLDDKNMRRRFRVSNFQSTTKIKPFCTTMPIGLSSGWNQIQFNLADFTRRAYGSQYIEALRVQVHANVRLRRIYFSERLYTEEELPQEYKLYLPLERKPRKTKPDKKEDAKAVKSAHAPPFPVEAPQEKPPAKESAAAPIREDKSKATVTPAMSDIAGTGDEDKGVASNVPDAEVVEEPFPGAPEVRKEMKEEPEIEEEPLQEEPYGAGDAIKEEGGE